MKHVLYALSFGALLSGMEADGIAALDTAQNWQENERKVAEDLYQVNEFGLPTYKIDYKNHHAGEPVLTPGSDEEKLFKCLHKKGINLFKGVAAKHGGNYVDLQRYLNELFNGLKIRCGKDNIDELVEYISNSKMSMGQLTNTISGWARSSGGMDEQDHKKRTEKAAIVRKEIQKNAAFIEKIANEISLLNIKLDEHKDTHTATAMNEVLTAISKCMNNLAGIKNSIKDVDNVALLNHEEKGQSGEILQRQRHAIKQLDMLIETMMTGILARITNQFNSTVGMYAVYQIFYSYLNLKYFESGEGYAQDFVDMLQYCGPKYDYIDKDENPISSTFPERFDNFMKKMCAGTALKDKSFINKDDIMAMANPVYASVFDEINNTIQEKAKKEVE